ncbi:hypothetical protein [Bifidobacterium tsurumiense]|nr:hypothetical protein [Bifidobacterium tsurumiense]
MQTRYGILSHGTSLLRRICAIGVSLGISLTLAACSMPRLAGRAESERTMSTCEASYAVAHANSTYIDTLPFDQLRLLSAQRAQNAWLQVAAVCSQRFSQGTVRAAQAMYRQYILSKRLGIANSVGTSSRLDGVTALAISDSAISSMALAEDRAGFIVEVLAARSVSNASLTISDNHKAAASQFLALSGTAKDNRQKVYAVDQIFAHPDTITDSSSGLTVPTIAATEMDCAREELAALTDMTQSSQASSSSASLSQDSSSPEDSSASQDSSPSEGSSSSSSSSQHSSSSTPTMSSSPSATSTADSDESPSASEDSSTDVLTNNAGYDNLAILIATHIYQALTFGYPNLDVALLVTK